MSEILPSLGFQVGTGAAGGFIVGYAIKKLSKLFAVLLGVFLLVLLYLGMSGVISINYDALWNLVNGVLHLAEAGASWFVSMVSLLPFAASFIGGFLLGLKMG